MQYVERVRHYTESMKLAAAVEREVWLEKGIEQGKNSIRLLIHKMTEAGEADRLSGLADEAFLAQMHEKYQI